MSFENRFKITFFITWKKVISSKIFLYLFFGFLLFLLFMFLNDSYEISFTFFLYLFPHMFLFLSQGMVREEIDSGCLENVFFLKENFRHYLFKKNFFLVFIGLPFSAAIFIAYVIYGLLTHNLSTFFIWQFFIGIIVGFYYVLLGIFLSYSFKGGSNVLVLIIGQVLVFFAFLFSASRSSLFIDYIDKGSFPDLVSNLKFMGLVVIFPNLVISQKFFIYAIEIFALSLILLLLQSIKVRKVELIKNE